MSSYQALVFDIDGTAMPNFLEAVPTERVIDTVAAYRDTFHLIAATGRPLRIARPIIQMLGITNICAVSGGTILYDPTRDEVLRTTHLAPAAVHAIYKLARQYNFEISFREDLISPEITDLHPSRAENVEIIFIGKLPLSAVAHFGTVLRAIPGICAEAVHDWSQSGTYAYIITDINATKEHAVAEILAGIGVPTHAAIGIGDGNNDLHLFRSVGLKVAMGNATPELKAAADIIAPPVDEDGLAHIIERYAGQPVLSANRN